MDIFATKIEGFKNKTDKEVLDYLFKFWELDSQGDNGIFKVVASYQKAGTDKYGRDYGFFVDVRSLNGDILYYPFRLGQIRIYTRHNESYMREKLWQIGVKLSTKYDYRKNNPFALQLDRVMGLPKNSFVDRLEKEKLIRKIFDETGATERDARSISNALLSIMGDLYTETDERFIFELLQNADDQPKSDRQAVGVTIKTLSEHLLFMHNGKPFTSADVESISSIGDSTKKNDIEKTGYKGIGFKSVFSDADTVFINSGDFSFCFDKYSPLYKDDNVDAIPWQLKPIWEEKYRLPKEIVSDADYFTSPVSIALQVGEKKIQVYDSLIKKLISEPRFMLFLRHIGNLKFYPNGEDRFIEIKKVVADGNITIIADNNISEWILSDFELDIPEDVSDEMQTEKLIPIKLKQAKRTKLSFAVSVDNGEIHSTKNSILFTYLPTKVGDFKFPFLVNADFLTTASRESIHSKSVWNKFLFKTIGTLIVEWAIQNKDKKGYLNLLLTKFLDIDNPLAENFNAAYKSALETKAFILNHKGELARQDEIILDKTGMSEIIGADLFCKIIGSDKSLPSKVIDSKILSEGIFEKIEKIIVIIDFITNNEQFNEWFVNSSDDDKAKLYDWIEKKNTKERTARIKKFVSFLPLFKFGDECKSFNNIKSEEDYVITTENVVPIKEILEKLGLKCSDNPFVNHPLNAFIDLQDEEKLFMTITKCDFTDLDASEKKTLFSVLKEFDGVGETHLRTKIALFCNINCKLMPLSQMAIYNPDCKPWLYDYVICKEDYSKDLDKYLVPNENVFDEIIREHYQDLDVSLLVLYQTYRNRDWKKFIRQLIDTRQVDGELLTIIEESDKNTKEYFLNSIPKVELSSDKSYKKDSLESRVLQIALSVLDKPSDFSYKIYFDGKCINEFSVSDDVVCEFTQNGTNKKVKMSLAKLLPQYINQSDSVKRFINCFDDKKNLDMFFGTIKTKSKYDINLELNKLLNIPESYFSLWNVEGNAYQYLFATYYRRQEKKWNNKYVPTIELSKESDCFIHELLDFLFVNDIAIGESPFTYHIHTFFIGKYFDSDYIFSEEQLLPIIERWASDDRKKNYLLDNGVRQKDDNSIRFRRLFLNNQMIDFIEDLSDVDLKAGIEFISLSDGYVRPFTGDNQKTVLLKLKDNKSCKLSDFWNLQEMQDRSVEWDSKEYIKWNEKKCIKIFIYPGFFPSQISYNDTVLLSYNDSGYDYYFDKSSKKLYINNSRKIEHILFEIAKEHTTGFDMDDYQTLCYNGKVMVSEEEFNESKKKIEDLEKENADLKEKLSRYQRNNSTASIDSSPDKNLSRNDRIAAQIEAQKALKQKAELNNWKWTFPNNFATENCFSTFEVLDKNLNAIPIVLKSYKDRSKPFKITPEEWDFVFKYDADIYVYTSFNGYSNDIVKIEKQELIKGQNVSLQFSVDNLEIEDRINSLSDSLHYFSGLHFDFDKFVVPPNAPKIEDIYNKTNGDKQPETNDDDMI